MVTSSSDVPMKGLVPLLEALAKLRTERDVELVVIGRPTEGGRVARTIDRLGLSAAVHCVSGISDDELAGLYAEAQVAVVPSLYEGFSLPAIEAMACGVPLVATTGGALPEVVGADGETALLVTPDDPGALAAGIRRILDDDGLAARLGEGGRQRVLGRFTWEATAKGTAEQYRLLLEDHRRANGARSRRADRRLRTVWAWAAVSGCSTSGAAAAATPSRPSGWAHGSWPSTRRRPRSPRSATPSAPCSTPARCGPTTRPVWSRATRLHLPFADGSFDRVIASEVLEHIPEDGSAMAELSRVLRPGRHHGRDRAPVRPRGRQLGPVERLPRRPRRPCPHLPAFHAHANGCGERGCVRSGKPPRPCAALALLVAALLGGAAPRRPPGRARLSPAARLGHHAAPRRLTRVTERVLNPFLGKSLVVYLEKPA